MSLKKRKSATESLLFHALASVKSNGSSAMLFNSCKFLPIKKRTEQFFYYTGCIDHTDLII